MAIILPSKTPADPQLVLVGSPTTYSERVSGGGMAGISTTVDDGIFGTDNEFLPNDLLVDYTTIFAVEVEDGALISTGQFVSSVFTSPGDNIFAQSAQITIMTEATTGSAQRVFGGTSQQEIVFVNDEPFSDLTAEGIVSTLFFPPNSSASIGYRIALVPLVSGAPTDISIPVNVRLEGSIDIFDNGALRSPIGGVSYAFGADDARTVYGFSASPMEASQSDSLNYGETETIFLTPNNAIPVTINAGITPGFMLRDGVGISSGGSLVVNAPVFEIDPDRMIEFQGEMVPANQIFSIAASSGAGFIGDFPISSSLAPGCSPDFGPLVALGDNVNVSCLSEDVDGFRSFGAEGLSVTVQLGAEVSLTLAPEGVIDDLVDQELLTFGTIQVVGLDQEVTNFGTVDATQNPFSAIYAEGAILSITNSGLVQALVEDAAALEAEGQAISIENTASGIVEVEGEAGAGLFASADGLDSEFEDALAEDVVVVNNGTIGLNGQFLIGLGGAAIEGSFQNSGQIFVEGQYGNSGINVIGEGNAIAHSGGADSQITLTNTSSSASLISAGISVTGTDNELFVEGAITTKGGSAFGIMVLGEGNSLAIAEAATIRTDGEGSSGLVIGGPPGLLPPTFAAADPDELTEEVLDLLGIARDTLATNGGEIVSADGNVATVQFWASDSQFTNNSTGRIIAEANSGTTAVSVRGTNNTIINANLIEAKGTGPSVAALTFRGDEHIFENKSSGIVDGDIVILPAASDVEGGNLQTAFTLRNSGLINGTFTLEDLDGAVDSNPTITIENEGNGVIGTDIGNEHKIILQDELGATILYSGDGDIKGSVETINAGTTSFDIGANGSIQGGEKTALQITGETAALTNQGTITALAASAVIIGQLPLSSNEDVQAAVMNGATGSISATGDEAVAVDFVAVTLSDEVRFDFTNSGRVEAKGQEAIGVRAVAGDIVFNNSGTVTVNGDKAEAIIAASQDINDTLTNSGTISATGTGANAVTFGVVELVNTATGVITASGEDATAVNGKDTSATAQTLGLSPDLGAHITNQGLIEATNGATAIITSLMDDTVINAGNIAGDVDLSLGNDRFIAAGTGQVLGIVDGGTGDTNMTDDTGVFVGGTDVLEVNTDNVAPIFGDNFINFERLEVTGTGTAELAGILNVGTAMVSEGSHLAAADAAITAVLEVAGSLSVTGALSAVQTSLSSGRLDLSGALNAPLEAEGVSTIAGTGQINGPLTILDGTTTIEGDIDVNDVTQVDGVLNLAGTFSGPVFVSNTGALVGSGMVDGLVLVQSGGVLAVGNSPGSIEIAGDLTLEAGAVIELEIGGTDAGQSDQLVIGGSANLTDAEIIIRFIDGFTPPEDFSLSLLEAEEVVGLSEATIVIEGAGDGAPVSVTVSDDGSITVETEETTPPTPITGETAFTVTTTTDEGVDGDTSGGLTDALLAAEAADGDGLSLREAIDLANLTEAADSISFDAGVFGDDATITLGGSQLEIMSDISIDGATAGGSVTIDADSQSRVFLIDDSGTEATLNGLTITGGQTSGPDEDGGGILVATGAALTLTNVAITGNIDGGGVENNGTLIATNSFFADNQALSGGGGGIDNTGTLILTDSTLSGNSANILGGGLLNTSGGTATLTNVTTSGNSATSGGGISNGGTLILANSTLFGNSASVLGGSILNEFTGTATALLANVTISGNSATNGGGIGGTSGITLVNSLVLGNSADNLGNEISISGPVDTINSLTDGDPEDVFAGIDLATGGGLLADNGGPVATIALLDSADNPALNAGLADAPLGITLDEAALGVDLNGDGDTDDLLDSIDDFGFDARGEGFDRASGDGVDLGAFELQVVSNAAPVALDDSATTDELASIIIDVLANDSDADGDSLTVTAASAANGEVVIGADGTLTYTPAIGFVGEDSISYSIDDGAGGVASAVVTVTVSDLATVIVGTPDTDDLSGSDADEQIFGLASNDEIDGGFGSDVIDGGAGDDEIFGDTDIFTNNPDAGDDVIDGGAGSDTIFGGAGDDILSGGGAGEAFDFGDNQAVIDLFGTSVVLVGDDIFGGFGNDTITGSEGFDRLDGGDGDDTIFGGDGVDGIEGGNGDDELYGEGGNDIFNGEAGDDLIDGGAGDDQLDGGLGNDTFVFSGGNDIILDFGADGDDDVLVFENGFSLDAATLSDMPDGLLIQFDMENSVILLGVTQAEFDADIV